MIIHFLMNPRKIGALCSSSKRLSEVITSNINIENATNIVEIGPGYGIFTNKILDKKHKDANFFALEVNPYIAKKLQKRLAKAEVDIEVDGAENLLELMKKRNINHLDLVISGLPWSLFTQKEQDKLLNIIYDSLKDGGYFVTFAYIIPTPQAKKFRKKLFDCFKKVETSEIIWTNIPPAFVYYCQK